MRRLVRPTLQRRRVGLSPGVLPDLTAAVTALVLEAVSSSSFQRSTQRLGHSRSTLCVTANGTVGALNEDIYAGDWTHRWDGQMDSSPAVGHPNMR